MAFYKVPSAIKRSINAFLLHILPLQMRKDINTILDPCCIPSLEIAEDFSCTGNSYTVFGDVTVTSDLPNTTATLIFTFTEPNGDISTSSQIVTFNSSGVWNGEVLLTTWIDDGTVDVTVGVIPNGSRVVRTSKSITVENVPNCN